MRGGVHIYVGITQSGKTTLAMNRMGEDIARDGLPALILDMGPALNFREIPHAKDPDEVTDKLYGFRSHVFYTPAGEEDFLSVVQSVHQTGACHVLVDEVRWCQSNREIPLAFTKALRGWAHGKYGPVTWHCTSQRPGDLHGDFYACLVGTLHAFKPAPGPDTDRLVHDFAMNADQLRALRRGEFIPYVGGFDGEAPHQPAVA